VLVAPSCGGDAERVRVVCRNAEGVQVFSGACPLRNVRVYHDGGGVIYTCEAWGVPTTRIVAAECFVNTPERP
jgi:hypothetical protein